MKPYLIGIAGLSGSGKTALSTDLKGHLDGCEVISLDSYYLPHPDLPSEARAALNYDHPDALDWPLLAAHLDALARGEAIEEPCYSFDLHTRTKQTRAVCAGAFLIVEGILSLHRDEIRRRLDLKIFVDTDPQECFRRRLARDVAERGRTPESVREQYQRSVWPMAREYVLPSREFADLVVSGEAPLEKSVAEVLGFLERRGNASA